MPRELTEFVHGVSPAFLEVGDTKAAAVRTKQQQNNNNNNNNNNMFASTTLGGSGSGSGSGSGPKSLPPPSSSSSSSSSSGVGGDGSGVFSKGAYFIGKAIWAKGYTELLDQLKGHADRTGGQHVPMDVYGGATIWRIFRTPPRTFTWRWTSKGPGTIYTRASTNTR